MRSSEQLAQDVENCIYEIRKTLTSYENAIPEEAVVKSCCEKYNVDSDYICKVADWDMTPPPDRIVRTPDGFLFVSDSKLLRRKHTYAKIKDDVILIGSKIKGAKRTIRDYSTSGLRAISFPINPKVDGVIVPKYTGSSIAFSIKEDFMINRQR